MKYKLDYDIGKLTINFQIKFIDILEMSTKQCKGDNLPLGERSRDLQTIINKLDIQNKEKILDKEEINLIEKYIYSFKIKNNEMLEKYWGKRSKNDLPYITALMLRSILRIKSEYNVESFWENDDLIIEELNNSLNKSNEEFDLFFKYKINEVIESEKLKLGKKKNNETKNNMKINKLASIDINLIKEKILLKDDINNGKQLDLTLFKLVQILFKILYKIREEAIHKQYITDKLLESIIQMYNDLPKEERYNAVYKSLNSLKRRLEDVTKDIENYKNIYNETVKKQEELINKGKITKSKAHINVVNLTNKQINSYVEMNLNKIDRKIENLQTEKCISKNKKILINKLLDDIE